MWMSDRWEQSWHIPPRCPPPPGRDAGSPSRSCSPSAPARAEPPPPGSAHLPPSRSPPSRSATCRSRSARRSTCARSSRPTSARRPSATSTRSWSTAATGAARGRLLAVVRPSDLPGPAGGGPRWPSTQRPRPNKARAERAGAGRRGLAAGAAERPERLHAEAAGRTSRRRPRHPPRRDRASSRPSTAWSPSAGSTRARWSGPNAGTGADPHRAAERRAAGLRAGQREGRSRACGSARPPAPSSTRCPGKRYTGKVVRLSPAFDPVARTVDAEVHLVEPAASCAPGCTAAARSSPRSTPTRWWSRPAPCRSPTAATTPSGAGRQGEAGRAPDRASTAATGSRCSTGSRPGDEIVTAGTDTLADGRRHPPGARASTRSRASRRPHRRRGEVGKGPRRHVADPARPPQPHLHPDDVAHDARPRVGVAHAALGRPLPQHRHPASSGWPPSTRGPAPSTSRSPSPCPSSAPSRPRRAWTGWRASPSRASRRSRSGSSTASTSTTRSSRSQQRVAQILNTLPPGHPAALHHQVRRHQHPGGAGGHERRGARREAALRPRPTTSSSRSSSAIQGVASARVGGGKVREIEVHGRGATRCAPAAWACSTW